MNGQMMNYSKYAESVKNTPYYTGNIPSVKIDYRGLIAYARKKGVSVHDLSDEEKESTHREKAMKELIKKLNIK